MSLVKLLAGSVYDVIVCCFHDFEQSMVVAMEKAGARNDIESFFKYKLR